MCESERERERESVCVRERECVCVCVWKKRERKMHLLQQELRAKDDMLEAVQSQAKLDIVNARTRGLDRGKTRRVRGEVCKSREISVGTNERVGNGQ